MKSGGSGLGAVVRQLRRRGGAGFEWYKESCLVRRIEIRMRARGVESLAGYAGLLARDSGEADRLLRALSVGVTGFFRNPDTWRRLGEMVAAQPPGTGERLSGWSMGCSTGQEAWSLAILLLAHGRRTGNPPDAGIQVVASDLDARALAVARTGNYPAAAAAPIRELFQEPFGAVRDSRFEIAPEVRARVVFRQEDLTGHVVPDLHDLVCCRNLLIFLGKEGQRRVLGAALRALRPGGLLVLGRTESLVAGLIGDLAPVDPTHRIYRRSR